jgi:ribonuclease HI
MYREIEMSRKKYYAVKLGFKTGVFFSWSECFHAIKGYSRPNFSAFYSLEEAKAFLSDPNAQVVSVNDPLHKRKARLK